jgi:hypothetical protein
MIWLIVLISISGGPPRVVERVPYNDVQSCQAEKVLRDSRPDYFRAGNGISIKRNVVCSEEAAAHVG